MVDSCKIFSASSTALKACEILFGVIFILQCVGIGTNFWVEIELNGVKYHSGLWKHCSCYTYSFYDSDDTCVCFSFSSYAYGWLKAVQALEVIGLIILIILGVMVFMQLFFTQSIGIKIWGILLTFLAGSCILTGVTVYGVYVVHFLNFSFGLCTAAGILCLVCGVLLIKDRNIAGRGQQTSRQYTNQGQVIQPPQTQVFVSYTNQTQPPGYPPPYAHVQYGPPPSYPNVMQQDRQMQPYYVQQSCPTAT